MKFKTKRDTNGYMYIYAPGHEWANKAGKIYEHVYVMCCHIGRKLNEDECVHHRDRDKTNNKLENLQLMTHSEHAKLHLEEDRGYNVELENRVCEYCRQDFKINIKQQLGRYCSPSCSSKGSRLFEISAEELREMVWKMPTVQVAKLFNVSDSAISKRCKVLGIDKPPRGYWRKVECSK